MANVTVYNLTDVATPDLEHRRLLNAHFAVGQHIVAPGSSVSVPDSATVRANVDLLVRVGALSLGSVPASYERAKKSRVAECAVEEAAKLTKKSKKGRK